MYYNFIIAKIFAVLVFNTHSPFMISLSNQGQYPSWVPIIPSGAKTALQVRGSDPSVFSQQCLLPFVITITLLVSVIQSCNLTSLWLASHCVSTYMYLYWLYHIYIFIYSQLGWLLTWLGVTLVIFLNHLFSHEVFRGSLTMPP